MENFDYLLKDENILEVELATIKTTDTMEEGISILVGDDLWGTEIVFTETDLIKMLQTVTGCDVEIKE